MGKIIGLVVLGGLLIIGGVMLWQSQKSEPEAVSEPMGMMSESLPEKSMVSSIKEAMGLGQKMQCTYAMNEGEQSIESTVTLDGERYQSTTVMSGITVYALFDGEHQYTWTSAAKTGMKMSKACLEKMGETMKDLTKPVETAPSVETSDMEKAFEMAKNVKCEVASRVDLSPPQDVVFTDQCVMMEQSMQMMEGMKQKLPAGMTMPDNVQMMAQ